MGKNRIKKKKNGSASMEIMSDEAAVDVPQAMDTSEAVAPSRPTASIRKAKGVQMKRTKSVRKKKAIAKAVSLNEKSVRKILKNESKELRTQSAKKLYD